MTPAPVLGLKSRAPLSTPLSKSDFYDPRVISLAPKSLHTYDLDCVKYFKKG